MALINDSHTTLDDTYLESWEDQLKNLRILLYEIQKGILTIIQQGHSQYSLNTGQSEQTVRRLSLSELKDMQIDVINQIDELEKLLGVRENVRQICPGW